VFAAALLMVVASAAPGAAQDASLDQQKELSRRAIEMWASNDFAMADATFVDGYVNHQEPDVSGGNKSLDLAAWQEIAGPFHSAFPDAEVEILMQFGEGDMVATRWQFAATQTGTYQGLAPTGKQITWTGAQIDRFEGGKIAETWVNWDKSTMFQQLGLE
jgi:predicted ester cyclase